MSFRKLRKAARGKDVVMVENKELVRKNREARKTKKLDTNSFMKKLESSNSFAAKHLRDKLFVKGKHRQINRERVIRIIRDVLDVINEKEVK